MPKPPGGHDPYKWTLDLPPGSQFSIGWSRNEIVDDEGKSSTGRPNEDRYYTCTYQDKIQLYMVLDGHDGTRACDFVQKHLPYSVLRSDLERDNISTALTMAFKNTEREFFIGIDPHITRRLTLVIEIQQKAENSHQASMLCPTQVEEIEHLDNQIKGGTTVVLALIYNGQLFVANVGDSRALLCSYSQDGKLVVKQLSKDHNTSSDEELRRLVECGLDATELRKAKRLGYQQNTRSIGDYSIKGGYSDVDTIRKAHHEPGTAEPYVSQPININQFTGFLILMSDGLYEAFEAWSGRPIRVNDDIAHLVSDEMKKTSDLSVVAQNVVEKVKYLFRGTCQKGKRSGRLDDITLIVRNFGHPMAIPHSESYPRDMASSTHLGGVGSHPYQGGQQDPPQLQTSISYPSHMHHQPGAGAHLAGGYMTPYGDSSYFQGAAKPVSHRSMTQPHVPLSSTAQFPPNYSGFQMEAQTRHPHANYPSLPSQPGGYHNRDYYQGGGGGGGGGYPSNYQHHQQSHKPVGYTVSAPKQHIPQHPAHSQRTGSHDFTAKMSSPEHGRQLAGGRQGYENVPNRLLNMISETTDSRLSASPSSSGASGGVQPPQHAPASVYENVTLRTQQQQHLQPNAEGQNLQPNRYSDSCLVDKMHGASIEDSSMKLTSNVSSNMDLPARPHSAEPQRIGNDSFISALPSSQDLECDLEDENFILYGWKKSPEDANSSLSTLKSQPGTLSSSELPSMSEGGVVSQPSSMSAPSSDIEARTPVPLNNGDSRQLGSSSGHHQVTNEQAKKTDQEEEEEDGSEDDEEGVYTADMSDFSETSEAEDGNEIDAESGEIRSYIKSWGNFPPNLSWEEL